MIVGKMDVELCDVVTRSGEGVKCYQENRSAVGSQGRIVI